MKQKRCYCLDQSEASCVVCGMPRSIDEAGLPDERMPLQGLAQHIAALVNGTGGSK